MQRAFVISALVALPMALLSCFLVLRGWALMGDAISHAVLPGIIVTYWSARRSRSGPLSRAWSAPPRPAS